MKKDHEHTEKEILATLAALDGIKKASPKSFLFTRILAKKENLELVQNPQVSPYWIKITISAMLLLIFFSLYSIMTVQNKNSVTSSGQSATELQSFIEDYYPQSPTVYNLEEKINP